MLWNRGTGNHLAQVDRIVSVSDDEVAAAMRALFGTLTT
jgi:threonine dehydratase